MKNHLSETDVAVRFSNNELAFKGALSQETVEAALAQSKKLIPSKQSIVVNFAEVSYCDSASLALITALIRFCSSIQTKMQLLNLPKEMLDLAKVSGLNGLLSLTI